MAHRQLGPGQARQRGGATTWLDRIRRGLVQISLPTILEVGYSAVSGPDWIDNVEAPPLSLMPLAAMAPVAETRAIEVQGLLAAQGHHRAPSVPDFIIAAVAEVGSLTVLHLDKDFELIASVTGQPVERLTT